MITTLPRQQAEDNTASPLGTPHVQARLDRMQDDDSHLDLIPDALSDETPETYLQPAASELSLTISALEKMAALVDEKSDFAERSAANRSLQALGHARRASSELQNGRELIRTQQPGSPYVGLVFDDARELTAVMGAIKAAGFENPSYIGCPEKALAHICRAYLAARRPQPVAS